MELYNINAVYSDYVYPVEYVKIVELNLTDFEMWYLMSNEQIDIRIKGLKSRYPSRKLIPFASEGYEQRKEYECFWDWFRDAINEMIEEISE